MIVVILGSVAVEHMAVLFLLTPVWCVASCAAPVQVHLQRMQTIPSIHDDLAQDILFGESSVLYMHFSAEQVFHALCHQQQNSC
jgi:hypothetical protein